MFSLLCPFTPTPTPLLTSHTSFPSPPPRRFSLTPLLSTPRLTSVTTAATNNQRLDPIDAEIEILEEEDEDEGRYTHQDIEFEAGEDEEYIRSRDEKDYDKNPEFGEIIGSCIDDPQKAQAQVEERIKKKKNKVLQSKAGSAKPVKVIFNKFDFSNSYIWFEFHAPLLPKDISLICDTIRSWHIIGRLGGCNSLNMQLSQDPLDTKNPSYDAIKGANVTPTTFYNIGDLEVQENLARVWVDIGTSEPLLLDILINALYNISSDYVGIKQLVFGGTGFENWQENLTSEDAGCSIHKI